MENYELMGIKLNSSNISLENHPLSLVITYLVICGMTPFNVRVDLLTFFNGTINIYH